jgi:RNA 3'-terminal phosphate cyclase (ATP)
VVEIDGSQGEGGGQVLRSALALSLLTGQALSIINIRAHRSSPGLRPQHLEAVKAAAEVGKAAVEGASIGSSALVFQPKAIRSGRFHFDIGTAGSTSLVFQTVLLPLSRATAASTVSIAGGTHVPRSPSFEYLEQHWLPYLRRIGFEARMELARAGFFPQGGGRIQATIRPAAEISPLRLTERGPLQQIRGLSAVANLDRKIAERQRNQVLRRLGDRYPLNDLRIGQFPSPTKGTTLMLLAEFERSQACFFALGELGKPAERVADEAVEALETFLESDGAIDPYLADQLLLPLSIASGVSQLRPSRVTNHLLTNASVIRAFLPVQLTIAGEPGQPGLVTIEPARSKKLVPNG